LATAGAINIATPGASSMKTTGDEKDTQECHGESLAPLAAFGECPYVKVLIHIYFFQGCQDCQPLSLAPFGGSLAVFRTCTGSKLPPAPLDDMGPTP